MTQQQKSNIALRWIAAAMRFGRLAILLIFIPIGIAVLIMGLGNLRDAYLTQQPDINLLSLGLTSLGGVLLIAALLVIMVLHLLEERITSRLKDREYSERGRNSISRLEKWLPRDSE